jgi:hypothetical protein
VRVLLDAGAPAEAELLTAERALRTAAGLPATRAPQLIPPTTSVMTLLVQDALAEQHSYVRAASVAILRPAIEGAVTLLRAELATEVSPRIGAAVHGVALELDTEPPEQAALVPVDAAIDASHPLPARRTPLVATLVVAGVVLVVLGVAFAWPLVLVGLAAVGAGAWLQIEHRRSTRTALATRDLRKRRAREDVAEASATWRELCASVDSTRRSGAEALDRIDAIAAAAPATAVTER